MVNRFTSKLTTNKTFFKTTNAPRILAKCSPRDVDGLFSSPAMSVSRAEAPARSRLSAKIVVCCSCRFFCSSTFSMRSCEISCSVAATSTAGRCSITFGFGGGVGFCSLSFNSEKKQGLMMSRLDMLEMVEIRDH